MGDYISSYTLDNKASLAILLELAKTLTQPQHTVYLVASAKEEVGAVGAMYFTQRLEIDRLIALEICPLSSEYPLQAGSEPVLLTRDAYGLYDDRLTQDLRTAAIEAGVPVQLTTLERFGSDASIAMKFGHIAQGACLSFPTHNTHGYEITHLGAIVGCIEILQAYCNAPT
jgi:putative aminopeptidase FrvX